MSDNKKQVVIRKLLILSFLPFLSFICLIGVLSAILSIGNVVTVIIVLVVAFVVYFCGVILYISMIEKKSFLQTIKDLFKVFS